jgi:hypothetical protein
MLAKSWLHWLFIAALTGIFILLVMWTMPVHAQCEYPPPVSSCISCHEKQLPVYENGEWHIVHGRKDICANCHGGNYSAVEKQQAHAGMVSNPLSDIYVSCHQCHPDYIERAVHFSALLQITPSSSATSTPVPVIPVSGGSGPGKIVFPSDLATAPTPQPLSIFVIGLAILFFFGLGLGWLGRHRTVI